jgi:GT2 family glycosyltransferase
MERDFLPAWVTQVELSRPLEDLIPSARSPADGYARAHTLVRLHGEPLGFVDIPFGDGRVSAAELAAAVRAELAGALASHAARDGIDGAELTVHGMPTPDSPACKRAGSHGDAEPSATVVVPSRERPGLLRRCLGSLLSLDYPRFEVIVVDSAPVTDATAKLVLGLGDPRVRYLVEPRPGVSRARNRALGETRGDVVAFTDDDVTVDRDWLRGLARGFTRAPTVGCVTGFVVTAELESESQLLFDRRVSWGRRCEQRLYDQSSHTVEDPLYPFIAGLFGTGASFAASRLALEQLGGFDEALGVGAPPAGGEDLDFFLRVVLAGMPIAYEPGAVAWHLHRRGEGALRRQLFGYGSGLTAYAFKHLISAETAGDVSRRVPEGLSRLLGSGPRSPTPGLPVRLRMVELAGAVVGPAAYVLGRGLARRERARRAKRQAKLRPRAGRETAA